MVATKWDREDREIDGASTTTKDTRWQSLQLSVSPRRHYCLPTCQPIIGKRHAVTADN